MTIDTIFPFLGHHTPNIQDIARGVHARLLAAVPGLHLVRGVTLDRFLHHDLDADGYVDGPESVQAAAGIEAKPIAAVAK